MTARGFTERHMSLATEIPIYPVQPGPSGFSAYSQPSHNSHQPQRPPSRHTLSFTVSVINADTHVSGRQGLSWGRLTDSQAPQRGQQEWEVNCNLCHKQTDSALAKYKYFMNTRVLRTERNYHDASDSWLRTKSLWLTEEKITFKNTHMPALTLKMLSWISRRKVGRKMFTRFQFQT